VVLPCTPATGRLPRARLRQARRVRDVDLAGRLHQQQLHRRAAARLRQPPRARARHQRHLRAPRPGASGPRAAPRMRTASARPEGGQVRRGVQGLGLPGPGEHARAPGALHAAVLLRCPALDKP